MVLASLQKTKYHDTNMSTVEVLDEDRCLECTDALFKAAPGARQRQWIPAALLAPHGLGWPREARRSHRRAEFVRGSVEKR